MANLTLQDQARALFADGSISAGLAREIFPRLVRQAGGAGPISYGMLAKELGRHHRGMDDALGRIGRSINLLARSWSEPIPPLEALVVFAKDELPRGGVDPFLLNHFSISPGQLAARRPTYCRMAIAAVQEYRFWPAVLQAFSLHSSTQGDDAPNPRKASPREFGGTGEGPEHRALRLWLKDNPAAIGLTGWPPGQTEVWLPSGDRIDVVFQRGASVRAVEVKSAISSAHDLGRGLYQCVKYREVMTLALSFEHRPAEVQAWLVHACTWPVQATAMRNHLKVPSYYVAQPAVCDVR